MPFQLTFSTDHPVTQWKSLMLVTIGVSCTALQVNLTGFSTSPSTVSVYVAGSNVGIGSWTL